MSSIVENIWWGLTSPLQAIKLIAGQPKTWPFVLLPLLVTLVGYYFVWADLYAPWQERISMAGSDWVAGVFGVESYGSVLSGLRYLINAILFVFFWVVMIFTFSSFANLITLPFNDFLAESIEPYCVPPLPHDYPTGWRAFMAAMWVDLKKTVLSSLILIATFFFSWIPILNIGALLLASLGMALQFSGFASTRRGFGARASLVLLIKTWPVSVSFGFASMILLSIPFFKILFFPVCIVAGTMMFARTWRANTQSSAH